MPDKSLLSESEPPAFRDAVAAIIRLDDGRYLLQCRDESRGIWYPGHWGCFGGAVDQGETPEQALVRELNEELNLRVHDPRPFCSLNFDLSDIGMRQYYRRYYEIDAKADILEELVLGEGAGYEAFSPAVALQEVTLTPYDAFALFLHHQRASLR